MTGLVIPNSGTSLGNNAVFITGRRSMNYALASLGMSSGTRKMSSLKGKVIAPAGFIPLPSTSDLEQPVVLGTNICTISSARNVLSVRAASLSPMGNYNNNGIKLTRQTTSVGAGSVAEFKFQATNFFTSNNKTHLAVIMRGLVTTATLQGKGIIIGNASAYPAHSGVCKPTSLTNDIGVESYWSGGNCVYGSVSNPRSLVDGVIYSVKIIVSDIRNTISFRIRGSDGYDKSQTITDAFYLNSSQTIPNARDFAIGTVPDTTGRTWKVDFGDIAYYTGK